MARHFAEISGLPSGCGITPDAIVGLEPSYICTIRSPSCYQRKNSGDASKFEYLECERVSRTTSDKQADTYEREGLLKAYITNEIVISIFK